MRQATDLVERRTFRGFLALRGVPPAGFGCGHAPHAPPGSPSCAESVALPKKLLEAVLVEKAGCTGWSHLRTYRDIFRHAVSSAAALALNCLRREKLKTQDMLIHFSVDEDQKRTHIYENASYAWLMRLNVISNSL